MGQISHLHARELADLRRQYRQLVLVQQQHLQLVQAAQLHGELPQLWGRGAVVACIACIIYNTSGRYHMGESCACESPACIV